MAKVRADCPDCGGIFTTSKDVTIWRSPLGDGYRFVCPECDTIVAKGAGHLTVELLAGTGAQQQNVEVPAEHIAPDDRSAVTHDDIIEFHELLEDADWLNFAMDGLENS